MSPARKRSTRPPSQGTSTDHGQTAHATTSSTSSVSGGQRALFVLGAGVEYVLGMPTMQTLMTDLVRYATAEGAPVSDAIRKPLRWLSFSFDKFAGEQRDDLIQRVFEGDTNLLHTLRSISGKLPKTPNMLAFSTLVDRMGRMGEVNLIQGADLEAVRAALGEDLGEVLSLVETGKIPLTDAPRLVLRNALREAQTSGAEFTEAEREALDDLLVATSNIEQLLADFFTQFLTGRRADQCRYLYLAWMLWAFLRHKVTTSSSLDLSLYPRLSDLTNRVITFNYTQFVSQAIPASSQVTFFHGRMDQLLHLDNREVVQMPQHLFATTDESSVVKFIQTLNLDVRAYPKVDLPGIVPPAMLKPIMSRQQLLAWAAADHALQEATLVVCAGYSFAVADEHFNDLVRHCNPYSRIVMVNPDQGAPLSSLCRILGLDHQNLKRATVGSYRMQQAGRLVYVQAKAEDITRQLLEAADSVDLA
jgi:hypothetical protein